jgi:hypothetical protein
MSEFNANPTQFQGPFQPPMPAPSVVYVPSTKIADRAARTAGLIGTLKWVLLVLNAIGSFIYIAIGANVSKPTATIDADGVASTDSNPFGMLFVAAGVGSLVVGTIVILVLFGWFQHMLATNAEMVRRLDRIGAGK